MASLPQLAPWLRLTPALSTIWIFLSTALASPIALWAFALVSAFGASRNRHPFDYLYNQGLRHWAGGPELPTNPAPRRFAMLLAAIWAAATGGLFTVGQLTAAYISGALLVCAGSLVATAHLCVGSLVYWGIVRLLPRAKQSAHSADEGRRGQET